MQAVRFINMTDGYRALFAGVQLTLARSVASNTCQLCFYYQFKRYLMDEHSFTDTVDTHILVSGIAVSINTSSNV